MTVQDHGGYVDLKNQEGEGTRFDLYFPVSHEGMGAAQARIPLDYYTGNERILVVGDSPEQRDISIKMLEKIGYIVASVSSGEEAVTYLKQSTADLMILDLVLGDGMDGLDIYRQILAGNSKQKTIIAGGFLDSENTKEAEKRGVPAIKKPFSLERIGLAVRKELDRPA